ncbi:hypothetical protein GHT06_021113 [Daphnia sinensis]|uniref:Uncharacterized protein n=1 Tax=Daphnia sinensis TaxID=1820382 RepID=A0AAD5L8W0_9CRUS|nr:hypothetical protein GHT06_021113 [Daphnia sinensis]
MLKRTNPVEISCTSILVFSMSPTEMSIEILRVWFSCNVALRWNLLFGVQTWPKFNVLSEFESLKLTSRKGTPSIDHLQNMYSPSNSNASNLPFGLPPHIATFLPKTEAINAIIENPSQENAETRVLGNQKQELHHQKYHHSGRYFDTSSQVAGGENTSQSCRYVPSNVSSNGDGGTEQNQVKIYPCDPRLNRNNGGQDFHNPHKTAHHDWIKSGQGPQMTSDSWSKQRLILPRLYGTLCRPVAAKKLAMRQVNVPSRTKKGNHALKCRSLSTETQEIGSSAEKPCGSRWATGANAVAQSVGRKTPVVGISVDNDPGAAGSSKMEESLQESFVTQKNIANATVSVEEKSLTYKDPIDELLASARRAVITKSNILPSENSNSSSSNTISTPNIAETDVRNINSCLPNIANAERPSGSKDNQKGNEKAEGKNKEKADGPICSLCNKKNGGHVQGCFNSKKVRSLRNLAKQRAEELAKKEKMFAAVFHKMKNDVASQTVSIESPEEKEFMARVDFIKSLPREDLEEIVLRHIYFCTANNRSSIQWELVKQNVLKLETYINMIENKLKQDDKRKPKHAHKPTRSIGIQVGSVVGATPAQQKIPLKPRPVQFKVQRVDANILPPSPELPTSTEDSSKSSCTPPSVGNADVAQLPCDPIGSSSNTTNEIVVKTDKQCTPTLRDNSLHPENYREQQETTVTSHIQPPLRKPPLNDADTPAKPAPKIKTIDASHLCHPPKQYPSPADPTNPSAKSNQLSKERPTNSTTDRTMGHLEQQRSTSSSTLQAEISTLSASMTRQIQQPSAASNSYQQTHVCNYGIQQSFVQIFCCLPKAVKEYTL